MKRYEKKHNCSLHGITCMWLTAWAIATLQDCFTNDYAAGQKINPSFSFWQWFREHIIYSHEGYLSNNGENPRPESKTLIQSMVTEIKQASISLPTKKGGTYG